MLEHQPDCKNTKNCIPFRCIVLLMRYWINLLCRGIDQIAIFVEISHFDCMHCEQLPASSK